MSRQSDEQLLDWFREWLIKTRAEAEQYERTAVQVPLPTNGSGVGLYRLIEEFTALRQEVKIQARAARSLGEDAEKLLAGLCSALETINSLNEVLPESRSTLEKNVALALAELDEAFTRGATQLEKLKKNLSASGNDSALRELDDCYAEQTGLARWLTRSFYQRVRKRMSSRTDDGHSRVLDAFSDGYGLIQQRLSRLMAAEGIQRINTVGRRVDPNQMIVIESAEGNAEPGTVVDEIRPGYLWNGSVLRFAEVRATKF